MKLCAMLTAYTGSGQNLSGCHAPRLNKKNKKSGRIGQVSMFCLPIQR